MNGWWTLALMGNLVGVGGGPMLFWVIWCEWEVDNCSYGWFDVSGRWTLALQGDTVWVGGKGGKKENVIFVGVFPSCVSPCSVGLSMFIPKIYLLFFDIYHLSKMSILFAGQHLVKRSGKVFFSQIRKNWSYTRILKFLRCMYIEVSIRTVARRLLLGDYRWGGLVHVIIYSVVMVQAIYVIRVRDIGYCVILSKVFNSCLPKYVRISTE